MYIFCGSAQHVFYSSGILYMVPVLYAFSAGQVVVASSYYGANM